MSLRNPSRRIQSRAGLILAIATATFFVAPNAWSDDCPLIQCSRMELNQELKVGVDTCVKKLGGTASCTADELRAYENHVDNADLRQKLNLSEKKQEKTNRRTAKVVQNGFSCERGTKFTKRKQHGEAVWGCANAGNIIVGKAVVWYTPGKQKRAELTYTEDGALNGPATFWRKDGTKESSGDFKNDQRVGNWNIYDARGEYSYYESDEHRQAFAQHAKEEIEAKKQAKVAKKKVQMYCDCQVALELLDQMKNHEQEVGRESGYVNKERLYNQGEAIVMIKEFVGAELNRVPASSIECAKKSSVDALMMCQQAAGEFKRKQLGAEY